MRTAAIVAAHAIEPLVLATAHPRNVRFGRRVRRSIIGSGRSRIRRPLPMTI
jgi:hypothetical protein